MLWTKVKTIGITGAAIALAVGTTTVAVKAAQGAKGAGGPGAQALQGTWTGEEIGAGAQKGQCRMTVSGDWLRFEGVRPQEWYAGKLTLKPKTNPKQATIQISECGVAQYVGKSAHMIYKLEQNQLTIAGNEPGRDVIPTEFERSEAKSTRVFVFSKQGK